MGHKIDLCAVDGLPLPAGYNIQRGFSIRICESVRILHGNSMKYGLSFDMDIILPRR